MKNDKTKIFHMKKRVKNRVFAAHKYKSQDSSLVYQVFHRRECVRVRESVKGVSREIWCGKEFTALKVLFLYVNSDRDILALQLTHCHKCKECKIGLSIFVLQLRKKIKNIYYYFYKLINFGY